MTSNTDIPPGTGETISDSGDFPFLVLEQRSFFFSFTEDVTKAVVAEIRKFFRDNPRVLSQYRWVGKTFTTPAGKSIEETDIDSPIHIYAAYPDQPRRYPSIELSNVSANLQDLWLRQDAGTILSDNPRFLTDPTQPEVLEVGEHLSGKIEFSITLTVRSRLAAERDILTDMLMHGLVGPLRRAWYSQNLNWLPNQGRVNAASEESDSAQQKVFNRQISFGLQGTWEDDFFYQAITIEDIIPESIRLDPV